MWTFKKENKSENVVTSSWDELTESAEEELTDEELWAVVGGAIPLRILGRCGYVCVKAPCCPGDPGYPGYPVEVR